MKKIDSLQSLRAIAFVLIFLCHVGISNNQAPLGVSIFFVLSGFLLSMKHIDDMECKYGIKESILFSLSKIKKLFFLHVVTTLFMSFLRLVSIISSGFVFSSFVRLFLNTLLNVSLLQSWIPNSDICTSLNGVAWYLSVCLFLYTIFPFVFRLIKRVNSISRLYIVGLFILLLQIFSCIPFIICLGTDSPIYIWFMYCFPLFRAGDFIIGICMGIIVNNVWVDKRLSLSLLKASVLEVFVLIITGLFFIFLNIHFTNVFVLSLQNWTSIYIVLAVFWITLYYKKSGMITKLLSNKTMIKLGDISAYAFLIHFVVIRYTESILNHINIEQSVFAKYSIIIIEFMITVLLSILYKRIHERLVHR